MRNFAIRPVSTALLTVNFASGWFSRFALATIFALGTLHAAHEAGAAEPTTSSLQQSIKNQLRYSSAKNDQALLQAWYGARNFQPVWVGKSGLTNQGKEAIAALSQVANEGLPPARYDLSALTKATTTPTIANQAALEVAISLAVQTYLHDLSYGAANPHAPHSGVEGLAAVEKGNFTKAVADARPSNPRYGQLSQQLKADRAAKSDKARVRETILSLEKLRWEQHDKDTGTTFAQLHTSLKQ